ncbi:MAG: hypothetical protein P1V51_09345 [Deltaproteobacteria bacterium]|nr:hypothetical protein [Deltaproteobacteria bacterium]
MSVGRAIAIGLVLLLGACADPASKKPCALIWVKGEPGAGLELGALRWAPAGAMRAIPGAPPGQRLLQVLPEGQGRRVRLELPGACPVELEAPGCGKLLPVELQGRHGAGGARRVLGALRGEVHLPDRCPEAGEGRLEWRVAAGEERVHPTQEEGRRVPVALVEPLPPPAPEGGVVPRSPAQAVGLELRGRFLAGKASYERSLRIDAWPRATGFPAVALGQSVALAEADLAPARIPAGGEEALSPAAPATGGRATFRPTVPGRYFLRRPDGSELQLSARRHDRTRMDCGRADCHPAEARAFARGAMSTIGRRGLEGELGPDFDPRCAIACHGTSEPGLPDGGALHVARELGFALPERGAPGTWESLPRDLRRVAGIGCTPCHGPGSLPDHRSSWVILRSSVCATCHDAPPRYGLVERWRQGAMSRADLRPETRRGPCARCHTTGGFLESIGDLSRPVVPEGEAQPGPAGIACAACHAPHREDAGPFGLRQPPIPPHLRIEAPPEEVRVCLPCHAAPPDEGAPRSSVADLYYGGSEENPHREVPGACLGCHPLKDFKVNSKVCVECHEEGLPPDPSATLRREALRLLGQPAPPGGEHLPWRLPADPDRARAQHLAGLVAADRAAGVHGPARARALLGEAATILDPDP